jgi:hypothetical protein
MTIVHPIPLLRSSAPVSLPYFQQNLIPGSWNHMNQTVSFLTYKDGIFVDFEYRRDVEADMRIIE